MRHTQTIAQPHGVTVFGSAVVRVEPDHATVRFSSIGTHDAAGEAVALASSQSNNICALLLRYGLPPGGIKTGRMNLARPAIAGKVQASLAHMITIRELDKLETILIALSDAAVANLESPLYQTSKLRDSRAEARQSAVLAAFKKAELYAEAAGVEIGRVLHIEEVDPADLQNANKFFSGAFEEFPNVGGYSPTALEIAAAAYVRSLSKVADNRKLPVSIASSKGRSSPRRALLYRLSLRALRS